MGFPGEISRQQRKQHRAAGSLSVPVHPDLCDRAWGGGPTGTRDGLRLPQWNLGFPAYVCASQLFPDNYGSGEGTGQLVRDQADV